MTTNKTPKIAFVKNSMSIDFYTITEGKVSEILESSKKPGPLALYSELNASLFIVDEEKAIECKSWKEAHYYGQKTYRTLRTNYNHSKSKKMRLISKKVSEIDWSAFDIVISFYTVIPKKIIKAHPSVMWCYYYWVPCPSYLLSNSYPLFGYNIFLNQRLSFNSINESMLEQIKTQKRGSINFPSYFLAKNTISKAFSVKNKAGIHVEPRSFKLATPKELKLLDKFAPVTSRAPFSQYIKQVSSRKYFVVLPKDMGLFRGNGFIESSSAGCLILAPKNVKVVHKDLILNECLYEDLKDLNKMLTKLENNLNDYKKLLKKQQTYHNKHVFKLPLQELLDAYQAFKTATITKKELKKIRRKDKRYYFLYLFFYLIFAKTYKFSRPIMKLFLKPFTKRTPEEFISDQIKNRKGNIF